MSIEARPNPLRRVRELQQEVIRCSFDPTLKGSARHQQLLEQLQVARRSMDSWQRRQRAS